MPIQGDQRASSPRSKIDSGQAISPSISGEGSTRQGQWLLCLRVPKCEAVKIVQRACRGRQLAANLQQWKQEQERIVRIVGHTSERIVIKCSVPSGSNPYDFGSMRVIHNLHAEPAFNVSAGWSLKKWEGFKTTRRKKNGQPVQQEEEFEHVRWYLQHVDGHVITCQPKAWMDTGGFAMYIQTVLAPWWQKQQTSWTGPDEFQAKRLLLVCDNASVHKADELKKLMDQHGIIFRFLRPT